MSGDERPMERWTRDTFELGEGLRWLGDRLVFVDILAGRLHQITDPATDEAHPELLVRVGVPLGAVAPVAGARDRWIAAVGTGFGLLRTGSARVEWVDRPEEAASPAVRMNDGVCDPAGRFWAGSMAYDGRRGAGSLYRVDPDLRVSRMLDGLTVPNGPAFSPDGAVMYLADSAEGTITAYDVDPATGDLGGGRPFARVAAGSPDGMTVDAGGGLWVAIWGGSVVRRFSPAGDHVADVPVPTPQPTAPCLYEVAGRCRLAVTSARYGLGEDLAGAGAVFRTTVAARALPAWPFRLAGSAPDPTRGGTTR